MQRAKRFAPEVDVLEVLEKTKLSPYEELKKFFETFEAAEDAILGTGKARKVFQPELNLNEKNQLTQPWSCENPQGLAKRGSAHLNQLRKATTGSFGCYDLTFRTSYEAVSVGLMLGNWQQVLGQRLGYGFVPYFRYETKGGATETRFDLSKVPTEKDRMSGFDICWDPSLDRYIRRSTINQQQRSAIRALVQAVCKIRPGIVGWMEEDHTRAVWSVGKPAETTIISAFQCRRASDPFWTPNATMLEVWSANK